MGSQWTNKYAILRDLSVAQGRQVPAEIIGSIAAGQTPPTIEIKEETEEEFYHSCIGGDGDQHIEPDLNLIKEMINMVKESDPGESGDTGDSVVISKLNPLSDEFVPKDKGNENTNKEINGKQPETNVKVVVEVCVNSVPRVKPQKKRRERNVAITSLLEKEQCLEENIKRDANATTLSSMINGEANNHTSVELKLLKPDDFITSTDSTITEAVDKVQEWLKTPIEPVTPKTKTINLMSTNMFKKKNPAILETTSMFKRKCETSSPETSDSDAAPRQPDKVFVPSNHADEYYKKFLERRQAQDKAEEDVWERAERLMKEIDAKRFKLKQKMVAATLDSAMGLINESNLAAEVTAINEDSSVQMNIPGLEKVRDSKAVLLPQHRHELPEECQVCLALARYRRRKDQVSCDTREISGDEGVSRNEASSDTAEKSDVTQ